MALLPFASNHNYDTSLLDIGKRNSVEISEEKVDTNSAIADEKKVPSSELKSDEVAGNDSVDEVAGNDSVDEIASDDNIAEDNEAEDKEESS